MKNVKKMKSFMESLLMTAFNFITLVYFLKEHWSRQIEIPNANLFISQQYYM